MKKITGAIALILAVFSLFYFSNTAMASKAAIEAGPSSQTVDLSSKIDASFNITNLDGASSVRVDLRMGSGPFVIVTGLSDITSTDNYSRTAQQMVDQFGYGEGQWKVVDNGQFNHESSLKDLTIQP